MITIANTSMAQSELSIVLLERPLALALWAAPLLFVLWGIWYRTRTRMAGRALLAGLLIVPCLFGFQAVIQTDREKLQVTTRLLSKAVQHGDVEAMVSLIDPNAAVSGVGDRTQFRQKVTSLLEKYSVQDNSIFDYQIELQHSRATLTCGARCWVKTAQFTQQVRSRWKLDFVRRDQRWLISDVLPLDIAGRSYSSIGDIP